MRLRRDRVLDEARQTADPVRLMRLFGVSGTTAMKYVARSGRAPPPPGGAVVCGD
jgi:hypothetical protein